MFLKFARSRNGGGNDSVVLPAYPDRSARERREESVRAS